MPKQDLTHVTLVIDRSGSMYSVRDDAIGGFNSFVEQQRTLPGKATLTFVQFDDRYEEVYRAKSMEEVPRLDESTFVPRGTTALYDALGRSLAETLEYVQALQEDERPSNVVIALLTDGHENASREYTYEKVSEVLARVRQKPGWEVIFLGADMDVVRAAERMGVGDGRSQVYDPSHKGTIVAFEYIARSVTSVRTGEAPPSEKDPKKKPN